MTHPMTEAERIAAGLSDRLRTNALDLARAGRPKSALLADEAADRIALLENALNRAAMRFDLAAENAKERAPVYRKWAGEVRALLKGTE